MYLKLPIQFLSFSVIPFLKTVDEEITILEDNSNQGDCIVVVSVNC